MARSALVLALIGLVTVSAAPRVSQLFSEELQGIAAYGGSLTEQLLGALSRHGGGDEKEKTFNIVVKYIVPGHVQEKFIETWKDVAEDVREEKGNNDLRLWKPLLDNVLFIATGEWESPEAFKQHTKSEHVKELAELVQDEDIVVSITPVAPIA
jgi:quinol monooxygenase YgiN